jgi:hypothetical protein
VWSVGYLPAPYSEPLSVTTQDADGRAYINGIYTTEYVDLTGVSTIKSGVERFWASRSQTSGTEYVELDFGSVKAINFLSPVRPSYSVGHHHRLRRR